MRALLVLMAALGLAGGFLLGQATAKPIVQAAPVVSTTLTDRDRAELRVRCLELVKGAVTAQIASRVVERCMHDLGEPIVFP